MTSVARLALAALFLLIQVPAQANEAGVRGFVDSLGQQVIAIVSDTNASQADKQAKFRTIFEQNADFDWIGKFVLGTHWRKATADQQQRYLTNYRGFVIANYADKFKKYSGQTYKILSVRHIDEGDYVVKMAIQDPNPNNPQIMTDYKIREENGGYKIFDIVVEGVSLITTQRSEFDSVVKRKGLDALIDLLAKKRG